MPLIYSNASADRTLDVVDKCAAEQSTQHILPVGRHARHGAQARIKSLQESDALTGDQAQQPADVAARGAQHRGQPVASVAFEMAAVHAVVALEMPDDRLNRLATPEQVSLLLADPFGLALMHDLHLWVVCLHTPIAQIHKRFVDLAALHR